MCGLGVGQKEKMRPSTERWVGDQASLGMSKLESDAVNSGETTTGSLVGGKRRHGIL